MTVRGVAADGQTVESAYRRRPGLDRPGYQAYTAQDASNGRHSTAYVAAINGTQAAIIGSGVQYENIYAGGAYSANSYSAPDVGTGERGIVYYTGRYIGLLNAPGSSEDLTPTNPGEGSSVITAQAAEVTGDVQITADFATSNVDGVVYNRVLPDYGESGSGLTDLVLEGTAINANGSFSGTAEQNNSGVGEYGGVFGGAGATEVAGALRVEGHIEDFENEIEYGLFVLGQCAPPASGPDCNLTP